MDDISNKTLVMIIAAAIVVSLGGTLISISKLSNVQLPGATGRVSETGTAQVSITESLSIRLTTDTVDFGTGFVNGTNPTCISSGTNLSTDGSGTNQNNCFLNSSGPITRSPDFVVENDGTVNASVAVYGPTNVSFFNGAAAADVHFRWKGSNAEASSCDGTLKDDYTEFSENTTLCTDLGWQDSQDTLTVEVNMGFPSSQASGQYQNTSITFNAVKA